MNERELLKSQLGELKKMKWNLTKMIARFILLVIFFISGFAGNTHHMVFMGLFLLISKELE